MKVFRLISFFISLSFFWLSINSFAKNAAISKETIDNTLFSQKPEVIELKSKLEQAITKSYKDRISTQIDSNHFNVSVQVTLVPVLKDGENKKTEEAPAIPIPHQIFQQIQI